MSEDKVTVRLATPDDAAGVANVHLNSWREAYKGILSQEFLDSLPQTFHSRSEMWKKHLSNDAKTQVFVAESSQYGVVGFVAATSGREERYKDWGEIGAIYLLRSFHHKGIGFQLLSSAFDFFRSRDFKKAYCWVIENNPTRSFYEKSGGRLLANDTKQEQVGGVEVTELAYGWDL